MARYTSGVPARALSLGSPRASIFFRQETAALKDGPMNLLYALSAQGNPLYQGEFGLHGRYQTYGQHSFIYDLIAAAHRRGVRVTLLVEGLSAFPLAEPLGNTLAFLKWMSRPNLGRSISP